MKFLGLDVLDDLITKIKNKVETELSTKANITSLNQKQDKLTAGANITIDENNVISATGGGGGGTTDYTQLSNKPSINNIILSGNKTLNDLNIQGKLTAGSNINITNNEISSITVKVLEDSVTLQDGSTCDLATGFYYTDIWEVEFQGTSQTTIVVGQYQLFYFEGGQAQTFITPAFQVYYTTDTQKWQKFLNDYNTDVIVDDNYKIPTSKAVYDALPTIATSITSSSTNDEVAGAKAVYDNSLDVYSTTEQRVGTWIDGKPLYRKTCVETMTSGTSMSVPLSLNIDTFVKLVTTIKKVATGNEDYENSFYSSTDDWGRAFFRNNTSTGMSLELRRGNNYSSRTFVYYIDLYYTKTTDTATTNSLNTTRLMNTGSLVGMGDRVEISEQVSEQVDEQVSEQVEETDQTRTEVSENEVSGDQIEKKESGEQAKTVEAVSAEETKHEN